MSLGPVAAFRIAQRPENDPGSFIEESPESPVRRINDAVVSDMIEQGSCDMSRDRLLIAPSASRLSVEHHPWSLVEAMTDIRREGPAAFRRGEVEPRKRCKDCNSVASDRP